MTWPWPVFPSVNAGLNAAAFVFLFSGWAAVRRGLKRAHMWLMFCALSASGIFLASYVTYHFFFHGFTRYRGQGILRPVYFTILISHTILAVAIVPFVIWAVSRALKENYEGHKRITRRLLPVWIYVSLTGVVIYLMLYVLKS